MATTTTRGVKLSRSGMTGLALMTIRSRDEVTDYFVEELASDTGRTFRLEKLPSQQRGDGDEAYYTRVGGNGSCDCPAGRFRPRVICRHRAALKALVGAGRI